MKFQTIFLSLLLAGGSMFAVSCGQQNSSETQKEAAEEAENESVETVEFFVRGNCEMCKERIETAFKNVDGVNKATWSIQTSMAEVSFDNTIATEEDFHHAAAHAGHRTENVNADEEAYSDLPPCCKDPEDDDYIPMN